MARERRRTTPTTTTTATRLARARARATLAHRTTLALRTTPGATAVAVRLPAGLWFDVSELFWALPGNPLQSDGVASFDVPAPLGHSPLMLRAGVVVPLRERPRRATRAMVGDPVSLLIGVGNASKWGGSGELYSDDGESFRHRDNTEFLRTRYQLHHSPGGKAGPAAWARGVR